MLHVGTPWHDGGTRALRLADESLGNVEHTPGQVSGLLAQVDANKRRDLVVTRAPGAQLAAEGHAGTIDQTALEGGVHVLIVGAGHEGAGSHVGVETAQCRMHVLALLIGQ